MTTQTTSEPPVRNEDEWGDVDGHISKWSCCGTVEHPYERHTFFGRRVPDLRLCLLPPADLPGNLCRTGHLPICGLVTEEINPNNHDLDPSGTYVADKRSRPVPRRATPATPFAGIAVALSPKEPSSPPTDTVTVGTGYLQGTGMVLRLPGAFRRR